MTHRANSTPEIILFIIYKSNIFVCIFGDIYYQNWLKRYIPIQDKNIANNSVWHVFIESQNYNDFVVTGNV